MNEILIGMIIGDITGILIGVSIMLGKVTDLKDALAKEKKNNCFLSRLYQDLWSEKVRELTEKKKPGRPRKGEK